jgi:hypothetical protein
LASSLLDERSSGVRGIDALGGERFAHGILCHAALDSLSQ